MIPTAYEFHWDLGHIVFLGIFYGVVTLVAVALGVAVHSWLGDLRRRRAPLIAWEEAFHDLPADRRHCRHEFLGTVPFLLCNHGFDCATCARHQAYSELERDRQAEEATLAPMGLHLSGQRYYHRGHTWVEPRSDGTLDIGVDDLAARCIGQPDRVALPAAGSELHQGDPVATVSRGRYRTRMLAPVPGRVVTAGDLRDGWLCRVQPTEPDASLTNLLHGREAETWMLRELEALQRLLSPDAGAPVLADGGLPVDDLVAAYPDADWDGIWGHVCLEA